ncbi:DUF3493 domain-containing protein [Acaryochloris sp. CCMEE 5410]|uniref:DUF3493 domain-containing protein n=1 Tax=Acaryochloris sp. CCMEE 5410 TaxID=310037 RepID=UPI0002484755|nr:DUF3493 domain-containing protein [Acaryochloris sp. CCMEE 5410]KAI9131514.1 DUF3493 domain-containing protein [Acaryochloris sp. CCMEE 5410]
MSQPPTPKSSRSSLNPEQLKQLRAELKSPYRGLRQFFYIAFAGSAFVGAVVFFFQLLAGKEITTTLPNFALQVGVLSLMLWLLWLERSRNRA